MKEWLEIKADQLLTGLLVGLTLALATHGPAGDGRSRGVSEGLSPPGSYADLGLLIPSVTHLAEVREEKDRIVYRAKSGARGRHPGMSTTAPGMQRRRSWDTLKENLIQQRLKPEPSLPFPQ